MFINRVSLQNWARQYKPDMPLLKKTARDFLPYGVAAAGLAFGIHHLYDTVPAVQETIDAGREILKAHQKLYEITSSALTLGAGSDLMAQRYEILAGQKQKIDWRRLARMSAFGGFSGGLVVRELFNLNLRLFPGDGFLPLAKRVALDQFGIAPPLIFFLLIVPQYLRGDSDCSCIFQKTFKKTINLLPLNMLVWGTCLAWIILASPSDTMLYIQNIIAPFWRAFLYHHSAEISEKKSETPNP